MSQVIRNPFRQPVREEGTRPGPVYRPDADILERPEEYVVLVDVPSADESSVQVRFEKEILSISAKPAATTPEPSWAPRHVEYQPGAYAREFRIAEDIEVDDIRASLKNGVLELHLPKSRKRRPRTIEVATA
jgi:HSP20 family protein